MDLPISYNDTVKRRGYFGTLRDRISSLIRIILADSNSRNLLGFLVLNLTFAFVELFYGVATNSLGLISDSFHMFFDCTGLLAGLVANVIIKWRSNDKYSYGYVRAEILAGFVNGLFLLFISFFIFSEAVERLVEPPEVKHERLLPVSIAGFLVNLVGIFVFQHGGAAHGHSHGGDESHGHSHGKENAPLLNNDHGHSHDGGHSHDKKPNHGHNHGHSHGGEDSQIMKGVFLHILADTLGSVGVIISAILMWLFDWMIADPICSIFIAIMIALSVFSLIADSVEILMQRQPRQLDGKLQECYDKVARLEGVQGVQETNFWTLCTKYYVGGVKLEVSRDADPKYVVTHTQLIFRAVGVTQLYVQLDYEHSSNTYKNLQSPNVY